MRTAGLAPRRQLAQLVPSVDASRLVFTGTDFTYTFLGLLAGFCGQWAAKHSATLINVPAALAVLAGIVLIYMGLRETGMMDRLVAFGGQRSSMESSTATTSPSAACSSGLLFAPFFRGRGRTGAFLAGLCTGFLPCGLLYGMLTLAASTQQVTFGGLTMLAFGLGTTPLMMLAGVSGQLLSLASRRWLFAAAAWCLLLTGVVSVVRGATYLTWYERPAPGCPFCSEAAK